MAINRSIIASVDITEVEIVAIEMVPTRPTLEYQPVAGTPNAIVGYYEVATDSVEMYVRDASGHRLLKLI